jgi:hypothetical protein
MAAARTSSGDRVDPAGVTPAIARRFSRTGGAVQTLEMDGCAGNEVVSGYGVVEAQPARRERKDVTSRRLGRGVDTGRLAGVTRLPPAFSTIWERIAPR